MAPYRLAISSYRLLVGLKGIYMRTGKALITILYSGVNYLSEKDTMPPAFIRYSFME